MVQQHKPAGALARSLSHEQMTMIALGSALGTGLFLGSGAAISVAGPAVIVCYALGSLIAAIIACAAGEMAVKYPVRGGFGTMAGRFLGAFGGYITRWAYWATTVCVAGAELVAVSTYLRYWWPELPMWWGIAAFGVGIILLNAFSVKSFGVVEFFLSGIKVFAVIAFILIGLILIFFGLPNHPAEGVGHLTEHGFMPNGVSSVWLAMALVMFSFGGVELISISAAEAKDPVRSVRAAGKATIWRLATFYVLALFVVMSLMPWSAAAESGELATSPFVLVFSEAGIPAAAAILNFIVLVAALSAANANVYAGTRLLHSLSYQGMAPRGFRRTSATGIPVRALVGSSVGILLVVILAASGISNVFVLMVALITSCVLVVWFMILLAYVFYRRREGASSSFRLIGGVPMAILGMAGLVSVFSTVFVLDDMRMAGLVGVAYFVVLTVLYFAVVRRHVTGDREAFEEADRATRVEA
ncbi:amino acid permease [Rothia halotolerans]|uniref:amino acid permease n=1 Tax=Rothia halotolerans TaxID=405770 RepID=UPI001EE145AE|nr:amino acid permease [Rothia halotolerans]